MPRDYRYRMPLFTKVTRKDVADLPGATGDHNPQGMREGHSRDLDMIVPRTSGSN
jgi:hypothetical protein